MLFKNLLFTIVAVLLAASPAAAESLDRALGLYKDGDYDEASLAFYDLMAHDANADVREEAQVYLAKSLQKMHILVPALFYFKEIMLDGKKGRFYLNAVEGLLEIQKEMHDPLFVPSLVNRYYDAKGFGQLSPDKIAQLNYLIGELSFRQRKNRDAKAFLEPIPAEHPLSLNAEYLLGLLEVRSGNTQGAQRFFRGILDRTENNDDEEAQRIRQLAAIAAGRASYSLGHYGDAVRYYGKVPRLGEQWFNAMYENAWAYFQQGEYGRALGELSSITSPYFNKRHVPEAYVIQGTTYFTNCQWDRVREAVARYKNVYEPMLTQLKAYLEAKHEPKDYYQDVVAGGGDKFSIELAREVRRSRRFHDYHFMIEHMAWEGKEAASLKMWQGTRMSEDLTDIIKQHHEQLVAAVGQWVGQQLHKKQAGLQHFQTQVDILDFEVADAERQWLEQGKEILKGRRARLPRPEIPNDQWQHWDFEKEYWKDELGYIQHSLACECLTAEECESVKSGK